MALKIYNSLGRKKEDFQPLDPAGKQVKMYCCGPTVYDFLHVGNFRGAVFYNFLRNWLTHLGYQVTYAYNFTDVDDKIINRAREEGVMDNVIAERYIHEFWQDFNALKLKKHDHNPKVTEHIPQIVQVIEKLIANGRAYVVDGEVLYSVRSFIGYGKLSGRNTDELQSGARVEVDPKKRDPLDFALWKPAKKDEQGWSSPWGQGRPGWHIECSAMNYSIHGEQIDIHGGGMDLIFPHHENEIAQSEGCTGKNFAKYWVHNNMFTFDGQKMSKSLGNIRTMRSFLQQFDAEIFKYMVLAVHYRSLADFSDATIQNAVSGLARVYSALAMARSYSDVPAVSDYTGLTNSSEASKFLAIVQAADANITEAVNDDFNTPKAFAEIYEVVRQFNGLVKRGQGTKHVAVCQIFLLFLSRYSKMMSLFNESPTEFLHSLDDILLTHKNLQRSAVQTLVDARIAARESKDYAKSDELRDQLVALGISLQDVPGSTYWEVKK